MKPLHVPTYFHWFSRVGGALSVVRRHDHAHGFMKVSFVSITPFCDEPIFYKMLSTFTRVELQCWSSAWAREGARRRVGLVGVLETDKVTEKVRRSSKCTHRKRKSQSHRKPSASEYRGKTDMEYSDHIYTTFRRRGEIEENTRQRRKLHPVGGRGETGNHNTSKRKHQSETFDKASQLKLMSGENLWYCGMQNSIGERADCHSMWGRLASLALVHLAKRLIATVSFAGIQAVNIPL